MYNARALHLKRKNIERFEKAAHNKEALTEKEIEYKALKAKKEKEIRAKAEKELVQIKENRMDGFKDKTAKIETCLQDKKKKQKIFERKAYLDFKDKLNEHKNYNTYGGSKSAEKRSPSTYGMKNNKVLDINEDQKSADDNEENSQKGFN